jgi:hypothetical protein
MLLLQTLRGMNLIGLIASMTTLLLVQARVIMTISQMAPHQHHQEGWRNAAESVDPPTLIEQVLNSQQCKHICDKLAHHAGLTPVQLQCKTPLEIAFHNVTLKKSLALMMDSTPLDVVFCFVKGLWTLMLRSNPQNVSCSKLESLVLAPVPC